ncbi:MAG: hypothetical protein ACRD5H_00920 [Nitrososphaerales archaeon]
MNIREYVEIYKQGDFLGIGAAGEGLKIRLLIGHKVVGIDFYVYEKYGAYVIPLTGSSAREAYEQLYMYAERTFAMLRAQPFWRKECKLYGYHFGQDYEIDGQGEI